MNIYEKLCQEADENGIILEEEYTFNTDRIKGLYCDNIIALNKNIRTTSERACVLAEELGHHYSSVGNIIDIKDVRNAKQEHIARVLAYDKMVGLTGIIQAYKRHCFNRCEMAEYLNVSEEFLNEALEYYHQKYGKCIKLDGYYIIFDPSLAVIELL